MKGSLSRFLRCHTQSTAWLIFVRDGGEESAELGGIEVITGADAAAEVEAKGLNGGDGVDHVGSADTACQEDRNGNQIANPATERPIMGAPGTAKLLERESGISGAQEEGIHMGGGGYGISDGLQSKNVDDLHQSDAGQLGAQLRVNLGRQVIAKLQRVGAATALLSNDGLGRTLRR